MLGVILLVPLSNSFDVTKGKVEYALTQLLIAVLRSIPAIASYYLGA
jgi:hypothetical protein